MSEETVSTLLHKQLEEQREMFIDEVNKQNLSVNEIYEKTGINKTSLYSFLGRRQLNMKPYNAMKLTQLLGKDFMKKLYITMKTHMAELEVEEKLSN